LIGDNPLDHNLTRVSKPLTQKQYDFVLNYIKNGFNGYQAAIDAGYTHSSAKVQASQLLANDTIKQRIDKAYQEAERKIIHNLGITYTWKMKRLKHVVEQYLPLDKDLKASDVKIGLQALTEMNKMMGDYAPDKRLNLTVDATTSKMKEVRKIYDEY
jgi:phage terminase small subunit